MENTDEMKSCIEGPPHRPRGGRAMAERRQGRQFCSGVWSENRAKEAPKPPEPVKYNTEPMSKNAMHLRASLGSSSIFQARQGKVKSTS
ncbi:hypothetical protein VDGL01_07473 [Verticillium dahliae]